MPKNKNDNNFFNKKIDGIKNITKDISKGASNVTKDISKGASNVTNDISKGASNTSNSFLCDKKIEWYKKKYDHYGKVILEKDKQLFADKSLIYNKNGHKYKDIHAKEQSLIYNKNGTKYKHLYNKNKQIIKENQPLIYDSNNNKYKDLYNDSQYLIFADISKPNSVVEPFESFIEPFIEPIDPTDQDLYKTKYYNVVAELDKTEWDLANADLRSNIELLYLTQEYNAEMTDLLNSQLVNKDPNLEKMKVIYRAEEHNLLLKINKMLDTFYYIFFLVFFIILIFTNNIFFSERFLIYIFIIIFPYTISFIYKYMKWIINFNEIKNHGPKNAFIDTTKMPDGYYI